MFRIFILPEQNLNSLVTDLKPTTFFDQLKKSYFSKEDVNAAKVSLNSLTLILCSWRLKNH